MSEDDSKFEQVDRLLLQRELEKEANQTAKRSVGEVFSQLGVLGANDTETGEVKDLMDRLEEGSIDPQLAAKRAQEILNSKMDYR